MKKNSFYPPKLNSLFVKFVHFILPFYLKNILNGLRVNISKEDLELINSLKDKHLLLLPNHPTEDDPYVFMEISRLLNLPMNSVAARETFDWDYGIRGKIFQLMGAYSLIRGVPDRESFMMTKKLLIEGLRPLVIFIEGEISNQNDVLIPFEAGVVQLAFKAQEEIPDSVKLLPIALKYIYEEGVEKEIKRAIIALEQATNIKSTSEDLIERIRNIGEKVLQVQEKRLSLSPSIGLTLTERIKIVKEKILDAIEDFLGIREHPPSEFLNRIRKVRNHMDKLAHSYNKPDELSSYEERMIEHLRKTFAEFYDELDRLVNFLIFDGDYLTQKATPERFVEVIKRLEREIFGRVKFNHPRTAQLKLGEVIDLKAHLEAYLSNKKTIVKSITSQLELTMESLLRL